MNFDGLFMHGLGVWGGSFFDTPKNVPPPLNGRPASCGCSRALLRFASSSRRAVVSPRVRATIADAGPVLGTGMRPSRMSAMAILSPATEGSGVGVATL